MAKVSGGSKSGKGITEKGNLVQFITAGIEDASTGLEPVNYIPYLDLYSTDAELVVEVEIPGVRQADIEVMVSRNTLSIKAIKYECFKENNINYVCMERSFGRIFRAVELPLPVDTANTKAFYQDGILKIVMPRVEEKRGKPRHIPIESAP